MDFYLMGVVFCKIQKQPNKRVVNSIRLNGIRLVCPLIYREGSLWDIDQKQTESWGWGNELLLTVWCFLRLLWYGFWTLGPKQIWVSDVVGEVSLSDLLFSWTLCIHQFIHLNIYQFLAAWKTRGFIQSISFNSLCVFVLLNNIWYHHCNFHFLVWMWQCKDVTWWARHWQYWHWGESRANKRSRCPFPDKSKEGKFEGPPPYTCRATILSHHQNISSHYFTVSEKFKTSSGNRSR